MQRAVAKNTRRPRKPASPTKGRTKQANVITPRPGTFVPITSADDPRFPGALAFVNEFLERESAAKAERARKKRHPPRVVFTEEAAAQLGRRAWELGRMLSAVRPLVWIMEEGRDDPSGDAAATALDAISFAGGIKADVIATELGAGIAGCYDAKEFDRIARAAGYAKGDRHGK